MYYTKKGQISTTRRQLNFKNQQEIWTGTSPNKIYRQQVSMWQDAQYTLMLIKQNEIFQHIRVAEIQNTAKTKCWWDVEQ